MITDPTENLSAETDFSESETLYNVSAFRYGEFLGDIMVREVFTASPDASVHEVAGEMARQRISSCVVCEEKNCPVGIVTERDMVRSVVAVGCPDPSRSRISSIMTKNPVVLRPDDTLFDALSLLAKNDIKHLPIAENGRLVGILTLRQLMKIRHSEPLVLIGELQQGRTVEDFRRIRARLFDMVDDRLRANIDPVDIVLMLSQINTSIHKRLLQLAVDATAGSPPADFCFFLSGSHGRRENFLFPDQDFGVIYSEVPETSRPSVDGWFRDLSERFSASLNEVGFEFCTGGVMGQNETWRRSVGEWKTFISGLFSRFEEEHAVRYATLIFDAVPLYGKKELFVPVIDHAFSQILTHHNVLRQMHEEEGSHKVPLGLFNWFITEKEGEHKGKIDMKRSGLIFIVEAARILAIRHAIRATSTIDRIRALSDQGALDRDEAEYYENAYKFILRHTLGAQVEHVRKEEGTGYYLDPRDLSERNRESLKRSFKAVSRLQDAVAVEFGQVL